MPRKKPEPRKPRRYLGENSTGNWDDFQDAPSGPDEILETYTGAQLQSPEKRPLLPLAELAVARPFSLSQEDFLDRLVQARAIASNVVAHYGGMPEKLSDPEMLGALVLGNRNIRSAYNHSAQLRKYNSVEFLEELRKDQPASHTEPITAEVLGVSAGGSKNEFKKHHVGIRLISRDLQAESAAATTTVGRLSGNAQSLTDKNGIILLANSPQRLFLASVEQVLHREISPILPAGTTVLLQPSPQFS